MSVSLTYTEVAAHQQPNDYYIVIRDKIIDISKFIDDHPGGEEVLKDVAGRDATEAFEDVGHSPDALSILATLRIGVLKKQAGDSAASKKKPSQAFPTAPKESSSVGPYVISICIVLGAYVAYRIL